RVVSPLWAKNDESFAFQGLSPARLDAERRCAAGGLARIQNYRSAQADVRIESGGLQPGSSGSALAEPVAPEIARTRQFSFSTRRGEWHPSAGTP
ncbi:MAG TPA: hypothetical protein VGK58_22220, partial [Lacipirellulaceae bacterium]